MDLQGRLNYKNPQSHCKPSKEPVQAPFWGIGAIEGTQTLICIDLWPKTFSWEGRVGYLVFWKVSQREACFIFTVVGCLLMAILGAIWEIHKELPSRAYSFSLHWEVCSYLLTYVEFKNLLSLFRLSNWSFIQHMTLIENSLSTQILYYRFYMCRCTYRWLH